MTDPHTFLPDWFGFPFRVSLERWRWRLGEVDGDICLVPDGPLHEPPFTGHPELLDRFVELASADDQAVERFANRFTGLYSTSGGTPLPEIVDAIRSEALVLYLLRSMARVRWAEARAIALGLGTKIPESIHVTRREAAATLQETLADLRPIEPGRVRSGLNPVRLSPSPHDAENEEWQFLQWTARTVAENWSIEVPLADWLAKPMHERDRAPAQPMPEVRCRNLLGYAYAQFIAQLQARSPLAPSGRTVLCRRCGATLPGQGPGGRRLRSDARWCSSCRRQMNAQRQEARRRRIRVGRGTAADTH